ncbi:MAG: hypothetical protein COB36_08205 [Alphaproteobacteria bacterium]|nr:MAG: hypothetical protein COB36_08205 [Alphaproteobacteria bacterium]
MKFYTRVAFLFVAFAAFPLSFSYADDAEKPAKELTIEEIKALIASLPTAGDVVKGAVSPKAQGFYDIYGRQVAFRESAQELRASLDVRRDNFEAPRVKAIDGYRDTVIQVYKAESATAQDDQGDEESAVKKDEDDDSVTISVEDSDEKVASSDDMQEEEEPGLMEKPIPSDSDEEGLPKKKVVMPDDAPEFDPANL